MGCVAIQNRGIAIANLARVVHDNNLGYEVCCLLGGIILGSSGTKSHNHTRLEHTSLNPSHWDSANATNLVDILKWESEGLV
ncbi:hypothetical protein PVL29_016833 [Vitis rotundifolia]|uniref:Uncharacterized protein n=1 Tax=Vitis rotundifolia TaxID=103349 RepID=A0AA38Z8V4_VITRO|nr:hypothetical protein PVL29_016833 [Vitis rotundifolia]